MALRLAILVASLILFVSCATQGIRFVHPQSGASAECSASGFGIGAAWVESTIAECTRRYESQGYVRLQKLTPEQRRDLEKRGLLPKD